MRRYLLPLVVALLTEYSWAYSGRVLHISDLHYNAEYDPQGDPKNNCHRTATTEGGDGLGRFGNYSCDASSLLVRKALDAAHSFLAEPDFVLWTGDSKPHGNFTEEGVIAVLNATTTLIRERFPLTLVLPVFGNHDYEPDDWLPDNTSLIYQATFELWEPWFGEQARETFLHGGYYKFTLNDTTFLMLNTVIYYRDDNATFSNVDDPAGQFAFVESVLEEAKSKHKPVHVIAHIAPGMYERSSRYWLRPTYNARLLNITVAYADTIKWMVFGHHHSDTFHIVRNATGDAVQLLLMGPAVSPGSIPLPGAGSVNPAFRVLHYEPKTWTINDIDTYYVDLGELNRDERTNFKLEYSMREAYDLPVIDPTSMSQLVQRLKTDDALFAKYVEYNSVRWTSEALVGDRRLAQLCALDNADYDAYWKCYQTTSCASRYAATLVALIVLTVLISA